MKIAFRPVLVLSLASLVLFATPRLRAATDAPSDKAASSKKPSDSDELFPLNKHNAIELYMQTLSSAGDRKTERHSLNPVFVAGDKAVKEVVAHPENANAIELAVAAARTLRQGDLEEAGFLILAAQLRAYYDFESYPPKKDATVNVRSLVGMLIGGVKSDVVIWELQLQPKVLADVVKHLETLQVKEPAGYKPGWEYTKHVAKPKLFANYKASMIDELKPTSELLLLPDYFAAFKRYWEFNALSPEAQKLPANLESRNQAVKAMKQIETEKKLHGVVYQIEDADVN